MIKSSLITKNLIFIGLFAMLAMTACNEDSESPEQFDRGKFLAYSADEKIIPAYEVLSGELSQLENAADAFIQNTDALTLQSLQQQWIKTHLSWQSAMIYNFGPAGADGLDRNLLEEISTFPVNRNGIEEKIALGEPGMNDFQRDTRGLLAVEYLVFGNEKNDEILNDFQDNNRKNYLLSVVSNSKKRVDEVLNEWKSGYREEFVTNDGTDAGSSTSLLYNEFVKSFEVMKNFKLGIPLGLRAGQTQVEPTMVEAYYSGQSLPLIRANFEAFADFWYGDESGSADSYGFKYYLQNVEGGTSLISATEEQIASIRSQLDLQDYDTPLAIQIESGNQNLVNLHTEIQKLTRFFKSDLSSLIGIAITYDSGDGD